MKSGRRGGREEVVVEEERRGEALTRSIICAILSSSSGQMSGQWLKPKYTYPTIRVSTALFCSHNLRFKSWGREDVPENISPSYPHP
jgi:hypothetical protein